MIELFIIDSVCQNLDTYDSQKIKEQVKYINKVLRIEYKTDLVIEFYPEQLSLVPKEIYFNRTEEFLFSEVFFKVKEQAFSASLHMSLGWLFDIIVMPKIDKKIHFEYQDLILLRVEIEKNLAKNIY